MQNISVREKTINRCVLDSIEYSERKGVWLRCRHFTYIIDGRRILARGTNSRKTHPANLTYPYVNREMQTISHIVGIHSEMRAALYLGMDNCRGLALLNVRIDRNGRVRQSRPCRGCMEMIMRAGFAEILHTDDDGKVVRLGAQNPLGVTRRLHA